MISTWNKRKNVQYIFRNAYTVLYEGSKNDIQKIQSINKLALYSWRTQAHTAARIACIVDEGDINYCFVTFIYNIIDRCTNNTK